MISVIKSTKFPEVLVVTPLLPEHKISRETKQSIKRNTVKYFWVSAQSNQNIPTNLELGLEWAESENGPRHKPKYYIMIDNDIILGRHMLDRLYEALEKSKDPNIGYAYASFEFKGAMNYKFPAVPFDPKRLMTANYISSNSMFKWNLWKDVGLVKDDKYKRLLDWAFLLKCLKEGYTGLPVPKANFTAISFEDSVSAGSHQDYSIKSQRVIRDFVEN
jgi:hypothetical protein